MNKSVDFSQPQRQSLPGILVLFANSLQKTVRALWPMLLIWLVKFDSLNKIVFFGVQSLIAKKIPIEMPFINR